MAVAVADITQCPYCIQIHTGNARKAGATDAELTEAAMVATALRTGGAVTHATHALSGQGLFKKQAAADVTRRKSNKG